MPPSQEVKKLHNELFVQMNKIFNPGTDMFAELKRLAHTYLKGGVLDRCKNMMDLLERLQGAGHIKAGDYAKLKDMVKKAECNHDDCLEIIEETEKDIRNAQSTNDQPRDIEEGATSSSSTSQANFFPSSAKRVKRKASDGHDGVGSNTGHGASVVQTKTRYNKGRGLCLILNFFAQDRTGTDIDVENLTTFLESVNCEVSSHNDLRLDQVQRCLSETQTKLNSEFQSPKYEYFICAILSHGDKDGIKTMDDQRITMDEIAAMFKIDKMPRFAGRPRVFLVQACRGTEGQRSIDRSDDDMSDITDVVGQIKVPTDSDILLAYATTPGMQSFRRDGKGSWFIHELVKILKEDHETEHLEEMLISVRENVAINYSTNKGIKQMPCSWSTLTKRLYF